MKDYCLNKGQRKMFILKYDIVDDNIIIRLASGEDYTIPYNEENEKNVLNKMEEQLNIPLSTENKLNKNVRNSVVNIVTGTIWILVWSHLLITGTSKSLGLSWFVVVLNTVSVILNVGAFIYNKAIRDDICKSKFFLDNANVLNKAFTREDVLETTVIRPKLINQEINKSNLLIGVSERTKSMIASTPLGRCVFDINSIDGMSLKDLKTIRDNIQRCQEFGFVEDKGRTRILKP